MTTPSNISGILSLPVASIEGTPEGTLCTINADGKLVAWDAGADNAAMLLVTIVDPLERGDLVSAVVAGNQPGSVKVRAVAGTYVLGAPVYASAGGKATAAAGTRQIGVCASSATLDAEGFAEVFLQFVPAA